MRLRRESKNKYRKMGPYTTRDGQAILWEKYDRLAEANGSNRGPITTWHS